MTATEAVAAAKHAAEAGDLDAAWTIMRAHRVHLEHDAGFAWAWLVLADRSKGASADEIAAIADEWFGHPQIVMLACSQLLDPIDGRPPSDPIPPDDKAAVAAAVLDLCVHELNDDDRRDPELGGELYNLQGDAWRHAGPQHDAKAMAAYDHAIAAAPDNADWRFNRGLLLKHRGRWSDGAAEYRGLWEQFGDEDAVLWNLAICSTGAGDGGTALSAWRALGLTGELGADGLPAIENLNRVKVRLGSADAGFEHVWVEPRSPVHGQVLNPPMGEVDVEIDDAILWDGAPIGYTEVDGASVPRFAMLTRLRRGDAQSVRVTATQSEPGALAELGERLPEGLSIYVFDEQVQMLCAECIRSGGPHTEAHGDPKTGAVEAKLIIRPPATREVAAAALRKEGDADPRVELVERVEGP